MRALFSCALAIMLSFGRGEGQSGTIVYGWVASLDVEAPGDMAAVRSAFEAGTRAPFVLHFTPSESLMVRGSVEGEAQFSPASFRPNNTNLNVLVQILAAWFAAEPNVLHQAYVDEDGSGVKVLSSLYGELHKVETAVAAVEWTITDEQKQHQGYPVTVAVGEAEGGRVEAWFAPGIPVSGGPAAYGGLPGMILMLSLDGGRTTYAAREISLDGVEEGLIQMPEMGEVRSEEAYRSIVTDDVMKLRQYVRGMVRTFGNVKCTVGVHTVELPGMTLLQCNQSRGDPLQ